MGRKAGIWIAAAAVAVTASVAAAVVFGAGASGPATVKRAGALHLQARMEAPAAARSLRATAAAKRRPPIVYGATKPQFVAPGSHTVTVAGCPRRYHVTNGSAAAVQASDTQFLTINGSGPAPNKRRVVKGWFVDVTNTTTTPVPVIAFIVCQRPR